MFALARPVAAMILVASLAGLAGAAGPAGAEDAETPTVAEVEAAQAAAAESADSVAEVQARLAAANERLWATSIAAEQATEAYNGARWRLQGAKKAARKAEREALAASEDAARQQQAYSDAVVSSYQTAPELTALNSIMQSDGIESMIERSSTMMVAESAMSTRYDELRAANRRAQKAAAKAERTRTKAADAAAETRKARDGARAAAQSAACAAAAITGEREALIARWAELKGISVELAAEREEALAAPPPAPPAAPAVEDTTEQPNTPVKEPQPGKPTPGTSPSPAPGKPTPTPGKTPSPTPTPVKPPVKPPVEPPVSAPPVSGGAGQAIAFARAQIGEPYRWGASGPKAWDCSGLTMMAWSAAGKSLPHYSVAQYSQSTPISKSQLQPGDLLFWGSSRSSRSIYHVALYVGGGQMIHAPRPGKPVAQVSITEWIAPNFFARP